MGVGGGGGVGYENVACGMCIVCECDVGLCGRRHIIGVCVLEFICVFPCIL